MGSVWERTGFEGRLKYWSVRGNKRIWVSCGPEERSCRTGTERLSWLYLRVGMHAAIRHAYWWDYCVHCLQLISIKVCISLQHTDAFEVALFIGLLPECILFSLQCSSVSFLVPPSCCLPILQGYSLLNEMVSEVSVYCKWNSDPVNANYFHLIKRGGGGGLQRDAAIHSDGLKFSAQSEKTGTKTEWLISRWLSVSGAHLCHQKPLCFYHLEPSRAACPWSTATRVNCEELVKRGTAPGPNSSRPGSHPSFCSVYCFTVSAVLLALTACLSLSPLSCPWQLFFLSSLLLCPHKHPLPPPLCTPRGGQQPPSLLGVASFSCVSISHTYMYNEFIL